MPGQRRHSRIDTIELKRRIETRLGPVKSGKYFSVLNSYFSLRIHKAEFDGLCIGLLGRNNLVLHNDLIRAILKNASSSKVPPPCNNGRSFISKAPTRNAEVEKNGFHSSSLQLLCRNVFPRSPRKMRTQNKRDRECKDRPSPLGHHCKNPQDKGLQDLAPEILPLEVITSSGIEDLEQQRKGSFGFHNGGSPVITAPFGVCLNGTEKRKLSTRLSSGTCCLNAELPDTISLSRRLEENLRTDHNLSVSKDCVNLLNSGLDMFIKRLLRPCLDLAASRSQVNNQTSLLNGTRMLERVQISGKRSSTVAIADLRASVESNPAILGRDWPLQLEKISEHDSKGWSR